MNTTGTPVTVPMVRTWFDGDRACVSLYEQNVMDGSVGETILEIWDDWVFDAIEDGELDLNDPLGSMIRIAADVGLLVTSQTRALLH